MASGAPQTPIQEALSLSSALEFEGFSPERTRAQLKKLKVSDSDLLKVLAIYMRIGNNPDRANKKVRDPSKAAVVREVMSKMRIKTRAETPDDLTFPRIAASVAPLYLAFRREAVAAGQKISGSVVCDTPVELQDPAFSMLWGRGLEVESFLLAFGRAVSSGKKSDAEVDEQTQKFAEAAAAGMMSDGHMDIAAFDKAMTIQMALRWWQDA
jgi:hypothetical protein